MADSFGSRLMHAWSAFTNKDPTDAPGYTSFGTGTYSNQRPYRSRFTRGNERSIVKIGRAHV